MSDNDAEYRDNPYEIIDELDAQLTLARAALRYVWESWSEAEGGGQPEGWVFGPDAEMRAFLTEQEQSWHEAPADVQVFIRAQIGAWRAKR